MDAYTRSAMLLGRDAINKLQQTHVVVFGVGGVGGNCIETLARSGVGELTIIDNDTISITNLNRQIVALHSTIGKYKVDVMKERLLDINPNIKVNTYNLFILQDTIDQIDFTKFDYIVDAVDTISAKLLIIEYAKKANIPIISSMGTGNKLDPSKLMIMDISKTNHCPLAKVMRKELKNRNIKDVKVLSSNEIPIKQVISDNDEKTHKNVVPGSVAFVPNVAGMLIAREIILEVTNEIK